MVKSERINLNSMLSGTWKNECSVTPIHQVLNDRSKCKLLIISRYMNPIAGSICEYSKHQCFQCVFSDGWKA